jgi:RHS repeat-associated protein
MIMGYRIAEEMIIAKYAHGYTHNSVTPSVRVNGVVAYDRHADSTEQSHINPLGKGHTGGGTTGGSIPSLSHSMMAVHKDYTLDYASTLKNVIMEEEQDKETITYRHVFGPDRAHTVIYGIKCATIITPVPEPDAAVVGYEVNEETGELEQVTQEDFNLDDIMEYDDEEDYGAAPGPEMGEGGIMALSSSGSDKGVVKLYYHNDRLGSADYLTDNVKGKIRSYAGYDDWGTRTSKSVLLYDCREFDLVDQYTAHTLDPVLDVYFAQARMYDAADRRFMAADPVKGAVALVPSLVKYQYVLNNPLRYVDPFGLADQNPVNMLEDASNFSDASKIQYDRTDYYHVTGVMEVLGESAHFSATGNSTTLRLAYDGITVYVFMVMVVLTWYNQD